MGEREPQRSAGEREPQRSAGEREPQRSAGGRESPRGQQAGERAPEVSTQGNGNPTGQWAWAPDLRWWDVSGQERAKSSPHLQQTVSQTECLRQRESITPVLALGALDWGRPLRER